MFSAHYGSLLLVAAVMAGCSTPVVQQGETQDSRSPYEQREDALGTLLNEAWNASAEGRLDEAESRLSRAMRINPAAPEVYYQMALLRQLQGFLEQARQLAVRAMSLGPDDRHEQQLSRLLNGLDS
ncbi:MAG: tetratricopeptide repeat protein [Endozoicomonas sp.]